MSAKTNIKTDLRDKSVLKDALSKLNVNFTEHKAEENVSVVDYYGSKAGSKIELKLSKYVGFERSDDGVFSLVGDAHYEKGMFRNPDAAVKKTSQVYQATQTALALEANPNFTIENSNLDNCVEAEEIVIVANMA